MHRVQGNNEEPNSTVPDAPIYNTLEDPDYGQVDTNEHTDPLYNVIEGPESEDGALKGQSEEPTCYHVLEGPYSEGAQEYHVLEGPESDGAQVYGTLHGQDPHVYGTLNVTNVKKAYAGNRGYDSVITCLPSEQVNIYQQLNQDGQQYSTTYQALNYPDKTMCMNKSNESHSKA
jgi:hypothetical protein